MTPESLKKQVEEELSEHLSQPLRVLLTWTEESKNILLEEMSKFKNIKVFSFHYHMNINQLHHILSLPIGIVFPLHLGHNFYELPFWDKFLKKENLLDIWLKRFRIFADTELNPLYARIKKCKRTRVYFINEKKQLRMLEITHVGYIDRSHVFVGYAFRSGKFRDYSYASIKELYNDKYIQIDKKEFFQKLYECPLSIIENKVIRTLTKDELQERIMEANELRIPSISYSEIKVSDTVVDAIKNELNRFKTKKAFYDEYEVSAWKLTAMLKTEKEYDMYIGEDESLFYAKFLKAFIEKKEQKQIDLADFDPRNLFDFSELSRVQKIKEFIVYFYVRGKVVKFLITHIAYMKDRCICIGYDHHRQNHSSYFLEKNEEIYDENYNILTIDQLCQKMRTNIHKNFVKKQETKDSLEPKALVQTADLTMFQKIFLIGFTILFWSLVIYWIWW